MLLPIIKRAFPFTVVFVLLPMMLLLLFNLPRRIVFAQSSTVTLSPTQGPPATLVTATGSNWRPNDHLQVTWDDGTILVLDATIDPYGNFTIYFNVPGNAPPGNHTIKFTDVINRSSVTATFTVTG